MEINQPIDGKVKIDVGKERRDREKERGTGKKEEDPARVLFSFKGTPCNIYAF